MYPSRVCLTERRLGWVMLDTDRSYQVRPSFEDEFVGSLGARRLYPEWMVMSNRRAFRPPFDVYETDGDIVIKVEIAGVREEEIGISVDAHVLSISGTRRDSGDKLAYQRMEINYGDFTLEIRLPAEADEDAIEASYDRGFLLVRVPRRPRQTHVPITDLS
jgi:HSP20 family protein